MTFPPNVTQMTDRHGKPRYRFRKVGLPVRYLPDPADPSFLSEYEAALSGERKIKLRPTRPEPKASRRCRTVKAQDLASLAGRSIVYFVGAETGPVKIGTTNNIQSRFKTLQIGSARKLMVLAFVDGGRCLEAQYHATFKEFRQRGEWYLGDAVRDEVQRLILAGGCPTHIRRPLSNPRR
jgi:hypothetical protein